MIFAHVIQLLGNRSLPLMSEISQFVNLITFSGFFFCFGYVCYLAYLKKPFGQVYKKMLITASKTLVAFYISGFSYFIMIRHGEFNRDAIIDILLWNHIPGYSEFLISFSLVTFISIVLFIPLQKLARSNIAILTVSFALLFTTYIPYGNISSTQIGLLVGTTEFASFPVLQYLPFYLIGFFFAKNKIKFDFKVLLIAFIGTASTIIYIFKNDGALPNRFPPEILWITGPTLVLYLYFIAAGLADKLLWSKVKNYLIGVGQNTLIYLLMSNVFIFALTNKLHHPPLTLGESILLTLCILIGILFTISLIQQRKMTLPEAPPSTGHPIQPPS